jgi:hypothetical protein
LAHAKFSPHAFWSDRYLIAPASQKMLLGLYINLPDASMI